MYKGTIKIASKKTINEAPWCDRRLHIAFVNTLNLKLEIT